MAELKGQHLVTRIFEKDASVWTDDQESQEEIRKRLGWLDAPYLAQNAHSSIWKFCGMK